MRLLDDHHVSALAQLLGGRRAVVLTGAGVSTGSGIPDYRGPDGRLRKQLPMRYQEFVRDPEARARYWARSSVGWPRFSSARPNPAHRALASLETAGRVAGVITQNVDGLHQAAGSRSVLELHGSLSRVRCLECGRLEGRNRLQAQLEAINPGVAALSARAAGPRPDGDAELEAGDAVSFRVPPCAGCGGVLKPDVVFFGENVPSRWVDEAWRLFDQGEALLVLGSSLQVYSGRRFVLRAVERGIPVAILNRGPTRCDAVADVRLDDRVETVLPRIARALGALAPAATTGSG
jgi:NAD+-dependent protein deacetylase sirtuin 4